MFSCKYCGTRLPEAALFCFHCGGAVRWDDREDPEPKPPEEPVEPVESEEPVYGCSEKQGNLVYAPGYGLYYLEHFGAALSFLPEGGGAAERIITKANGCTMDGLNLWNGGLYFIRDTDKGTSLHRLELETGKRQMVCPLDTELTDTRFIVRNGVLYHSVYGGEEIKTLRLDTLEEGGVPIPNLRGRPLPEEWLAEERLVENLRDDVWSYGIKTAGLYLRDGYAWTSCGGYTHLSIRFPLEDPESFEFMPVDACCAQKAFGVLSYFPEKNAVLGTGGKSGDLYVTWLDSGKRQTVQRGIPANGKGWWRADNYFVLGDTLVDVGAMKRFKLRFTLKAQDFAPAGDGGVYLLTQSGLIYRLPPDFWRIPGAEALERCLMTWQED